MDMLSVFLLVLHLKKTIKQEKPLISKIQNCLLYRKEDSSFFKKSWQLRFRYKNAHIQQRTDVWNVHPRHGAVNN